MKFLWLFILFASGSSERILFIGIGSDVHKMCYMPIAKALADRGHNVTVVNSSPQFHSSVNVHEIIVRDISRDIHADLSKLLEESAFLQFLIKFRILKRIMTGHFGVLQNIDILQQESGLQQVYTIVNLLNTTVIKGYESLVENDQFRQIIRNRQVDLVVQLAANDFALPIIDSLHVPFVYYISQTVNSFTFDAMEMPKEYASIPSPLSGFDSQMSFLQRLENTLLSEYLSFMGWYSLGQTADQYVKKDYPHSRPIAEIKRDASLWLINHHLATAYARPLPPNVIPVGPQHVRPPKLPKDLQRIADASTDGFIVFALGPFDSPAPPWIQVFANALSKFPQRIIWQRGNTDNARMPSNNIVLVDSLPKQDFMGHPNCRLVICHGSLLNLQEAIYHKMAVLGFASSADEHSNLARAIKEGYAIKLDWDNFNEENLIKAISLLLHEPSYRANAVRLSNLMRDQLLPGTDVAVYWIEHVLRHGAAHLQLSSKNLNFIQKHLIDVWLFLAAVLAILAASCVLILRSFCKCLKTKLRRDVDSMADQHDSDNEQTKVLGRSFQHYQPELSQDEDSE